MLYCIDYGLPYEPGLPLWQEGRTPTLPCGKHFMLDTFEVMTSKTGTRSTRSKACNQLKPQNGKTLGTTLGGDGRRWSCHPGSKSHGSAHGDESGMLSLDCPPATGFTCSAVLYVFAIFCP